MDENIRKHENFNICSRLCQFNIDEILYAIYAMNLDQLVLWSHLIFSGYFISHTLPISIDVKSSLDGFIKRRI